MSGKMEYHEAKVDEMVLALLYLTSFTERGITRVWKGQDWDVLNRLHEKGLNQRSEEQGQIRNVERRSRERVSPTILEVFRKQ